MIEVVNGISFPQYGFTLSFVSMVLIGVIFTTEMTRCPQLQEM